MTCFRAPDEAETAAIRHIDFRGARVIHSIVNKIVAGGDGRTSRFHTERNERVAIGPAIRDLGGSVVGKLQTKIGLPRPAVPWWPVKVIPLIDAFLKPGMDAIEFGSGSSSIWIAGRVRSLVSVEDVAPWAKTTTERLQQHGLSNAKVLLRSKETYWSAGDQQTFDFAVVDGSYRWKCIEHILPCLRSGGMLYFDNADSDKDLQSYDEPNAHHLAQQRLQSYADATPGARLAKVASIVHGELFAGEGWLLFIP